MHRNYMMMGIGMKRFLFGLVFFGIVFMSSIGCYAENLKKVENTETIELNQHIDGVNIELSYSVIPGKNYQVTVCYKADEDAAKKLFIRYEDVSEDECTPNIVEQDDRSGLLYEEIKPNEEGFRSFYFAAIDDSLDLRISGPVTIEKIVLERYEDNVAGDKRTVYLVGDSQLKENSPKTGWAQVINKLFTEDVLFVNKAIGARSTGSYLKQGRWNEVLFDVAPGDYVFIDFGHNDGGSVVGRAVKLEDYKDYLMHQYVEGVRVRGAIPVIVSIANRNTVNKETGEFSQTLPKYVQAAREAADETDTYFIDLNARSIEFLTEYTKKNGIGSTTENLYVDGTHFTEAGAFEIAMLVVDEISKLNLEGLSEFCILPQVIPISEDTSDNVLEPYEPKEEIIAAPTEVLESTGDDKPDRDVYFIVFLVIGFCALVGYRFICGRKK